jgi:hypothetical protein
LPYPSEIETVIETVRKSLIAYTVSEQSGSVDDVSPDTAAWMIRAMSVYGFDNSMLTKARRKLAGRQLPDGRVALSPQMPHVHWYTALVILAWTRAPGLEDNVQRAIDFLIKADGIRCAAEVNHVISHDTSLGGWPWISGTHAWVEPTSMAVLALKVNGYEKHTRAIEAVTMLLDRQLPGGGWNFGNTFVYGTALRAIPEYTAIALSALHGYVAHDTVQNSLNYLEHELETIRTPLTLASGICALGIWAQRPQKSNDFIIESIKHQNRLGLYTMTLLSQVLVAFLTEDGFSVRNG